ncbi:sensor domain-containing diguanylate cyclase [Sphingomonas sp. PvP018]|uniref:sensor domain-containing diguanylate cyclase n=1 Tax=Sphingomonas sp. PvP018 TaxID=2817852 RepID=UPI001AE8E2A9|nr:sensor domain-containing diguanylate cyclase [Sphingomonas sp. PvP018]MBP2515216.1 diguanylate cyclase (GGDEF)-like protein [Sphingomonas sp. PvP018]
MNRIAHRVTELTRFAALPIATGVGYYLAAFASLYLTRGADGIAMLWPPSGILFAALLVEPRNRIVWHIGAAAMASLAANLGGGNGVLLSIGFTLANVSESGFAAWLLRNRTRRRDSFTDPKGLVWFCIAAAAAAALSATIAACATTAVGISFWLSWFTTDLLGILIVAPLILISGRAFYRKRFRDGLAAAPQAIAIFLLVASVSIIAFSQVNYSLLFLPMLAVLLAALRMGPFGAAGSVLIVATASSLAHIFGSDPQAIADGQAYARSIFLQFYLLALFAAALPIAALLATRQQLIDSNANKLRLLELAEGAAHVGHWHLDLLTQLITWSDEVFRIHGVENRVPPSLDTAIDAYHPDDRDAVSAHIGRSLEHCVGFEFTARIVRPDGEVRHVFSKGEIDRNGVNESVGLFGIIQDITTQVAHEAEMERARIRAETAARNAIILAETDQLTGIANRRRTSFVLEQTLLLARETGHPMSVAMFDIDHFKRINDTYGHQTGDEVLKRVAAGAAAELRSGDTIGRFGGEEFVIVLPDAAADAASKVAERVRHAIGTDSGTPGVTVSIGVAEMAPGETCDALLRRADDALYLAKNEGRNRMRLAA